MAKTSAGILLYRKTGDSIEVFLAHPGGPFWADKDEGAWTIPKGVVEDDEDNQTAAVREFEEETGIKLDGPFRDLGNVKQKSGKVVHGWACQGDADAATVRSNEVPTKWQGKWITVPEVDRCEWFDPETAIRKINPAQAEFILRLLTP
jgi:predicted NUDIX family NTP pyrophosphohydrolase